MRKVTRPNPNPNLNVVVDVRNKKTLKRFSYVHAVRPFRKSDWWPFGPVTRNSNDMMVPRMSRFWRTTSVCWHLSCFLYFLSRCLQEWYVEDVFHETIHSDIRIVIKLRRRSLFYFLNLIVPCLLIFFMSHLGFFLPLESGEKVSFQADIFLSLIVFLLTVGDNMPRTPKYIPLIGIHTVMYLCL